jgi:hypothetical protein
MDAITKKNIQRYEQTRIVNLMGDIEDTCQMMFHVAFPELHDYWKSEIVDHTETRSKIARFRCKLENTLKALKA